ncbi:hypothetical protein [Marinimicrobium sp. ABcell2]|uniref:hypothetical protein n=1 Tax=Marinimicrobium sp. ABcell2 TaxID=3069751 RepID=UPI0027B624E1|nr:hypothetical protein [Marinimicrobium sp. ABcell2]MDQ2078320.1 hypothetical protein [Marinimicrobium sp. ABcell2]
MKLDKPLNLDFSVGDTDDYASDKAKELKSKIEDRDKQIAKLQAMQYGLNHRVEGSSHLLGGAWVDRIYKKRDLTVLADDSGSDKGFKKHLYSTVYQEFIKPGHVDTILEVGLLCHSDQRDLGGNSFDVAPSLDMWCQYLPGAKVYGFDIQDFSKAKGDWQAVFRGDQSSRDDLQKVIEKESAFDVIIDDALHASKHQQVTFSFLFRHLKSGGVFIIEDLHFQPFDEPGETKTLELLRRLSWDGTWESKHATAGEREYIEKNVKEVLFFDSMKLPRTESRDAFCVIKKL